MSPDSRDIDGEIDLLRSLTNRLLSTRPIDHVQVSRYLRLIIRAFSAQAKAPRHLTDQQQIDNLIKKVFQDNVDSGDLRFHDLVPVRMARPGDKWWPWRQLLPLQVRWGYGLIDPDEPWPHEENEKLAQREAMDRIASEAYLNPDFLTDLDTEDEDSDDDEDPPPDDWPYNHNPEDDEHPPDLAVIPAHLSVVPAETGTHPPIPTEAGLDPSPLDPFDEDPPNTPPHIPRGRPPP